MNGLMMITLTVALACVALYNIVSNDKLKTQIKWMEKLFDEKRNHYHWRIEELQEKLRQINEEKE
jgi:hypothetical protein